MKSLIQVFAVDGTEHLRGSSVVAGTTKGRCLCGAPARYSACVQLPCLAAPYSGGLCRSCLDQLADDTELLNVFNHLVVATYLPHNLKAHNAMCKRLSLKNNAKSEPLVPADQLN